MSEQEMVPGLEELSGKVLGDVASSMSVLLAYIGDQTGVYRTMDEIGAASAGEIAAKAGVDERYLVEFLSANAAAGYVDYDAATEKFSLNEAQSLIFTREGQPACMQGFFQLVVSTFLDEEKAKRIFKTGEGLSWGDHHPCLFCGTDRFFRPGYKANLLDAWIPALDGVAEKLKAGGAVIDIGCGHGSSTLLMAEQFPKSRFVGIDYHDASIASAREAAKEAGSPGNLSFEVAKAKEFGGGPYDFACIFDALHDMGDPVGAARHIRDNLKPDGTLMVVEPQAGDKLEDNLHLLGNVFYAGSTLLCVPASRSQEVGLQLGAQAGEKRLTEVLKEAGFSSVRRAAETPINMVLEARP